MSLVFSSAEGASTDEDETTGSLVAVVDGVEVRESSWAGAYYCAHVLWQLSTWAARPGSTAARNAAGDPLVGFLHVPADPETVSLVTEGRRSKQERHARTLRVLSWAIRGFLEHLNAHPEPRILLTGFGRFAEVTSNPTGELVGDGPLVSELLLQTTGLAPQRDQDARGSAELEVLSAGRLRVGRLVLDVSDAALEETRAGSLPWALDRFAPHAVISLGVHRRASMFRVELLPTTAGLSVDGARLQHEDGRPADARLPNNQAMALAIARGARVALIPALPA